MTLVAQYDDSRWGSGCFCQHKSFCACNVSSHNTHTIT